VNQESTGTSVRAVFADGRSCAGWTWPTGFKFHGRTEPATEAEILEAITFSWLDGNDSCDCNRAAYLASEVGAPDPDMRCGDTIELSALFATTPDGTVHVLFYKEHA